MGLAHLLGLAFAFAINETEDAQDDFNDEARQLPNLIGNGQVSYPISFNFSLVLALLALGLYATLGFWPYLYGAASIVLGFAYSFRRIRLKAWPIVDIASHSLMLGGLQFWVGASLYGLTGTLPVVIFAVICLFSAHGQLFNQLRDLTADKNAGLRNTTILLGRQVALLVKKAILVAIGVLIVWLAFNLDISWLILPLAAAIFGIFRLIKIDMSLMVRTNRNSGHYMNGLLTANLVVNLLVVGWGVYDLVGQQLIGVGFRVMALPWGWVSRLI